MQTIRYIRFGKVCGGKGVLDGKTLDVLVYICVETKIENAEFLLLLHLFFARLIDA